MFVQQHCELQKGKSDFKEGKMGLMFYSGFIPNLGHSMIIPSVILAQAEELACWKCKMQNPHVE